MGGKKAGGRRGCGQLRGCGGHSDTPYCNAAERTNIQPEAKGAEWGWSMELDRTGSMRRLLNVRPSSFASPMLGAVWQIVVNHGTGSP
jgi:hypothetical protein